MTTRDPRLPQWVTTLTFEQYERACAEADSAPPLTARQRATLRAIFATRRRRSDDTTTTEGR